MISNTATVRQFPNYRVFDSPLSRDITGYCSPGSVHRPGTGYELRHKKAKTIIAFRSIANKSCIILCAPNENIVKTDRK